MAVERDHHVADLAAGGRAPSGADDELNLEAAVVVEEGVTVTEEVDADDEVEIAVGVEVFGLDHAGAVGLFEDPAHSLKPVPSSLRRS